VGAGIASIASQKARQRKPLPPVETFFTTDLSLSVADILAQYRAAGPWKLR